MKQKIENLIKNEDIKNPLTDDTISRMLNMRRDEVTYLRNELGIEDSRKRRKEVLEKAIKEIVINRNTTNKNDIVKELKDTGFNVSRSTISKYMEEIEYELYEKKESSKNSNDYFKVNNAFENLIGYNSSLKPIIELAKAAVLYPPSGLHTIIMGPTGVGKSELAECMYKFAIESKVIKEDAPFIIFNAADYSENPQLLLSQLFGHVKGAFTGADVTKEGLVANANGGILFIDEIHRLPH